jgi:hypothetical protein
MQGCILIATLKIGAAQVGTRNSIPGGNSGCCTFPYISMKFTWYVVSFMLIPILQQKQKSRLWPFFFGLFLRVYLSGDYYNIVSAFPVNLCHVWLIGKAVGLHWNCLDSQVPPFLMQFSCIPACSNSRSNLLVKAVNHSKSSLIHLNSVKNRKLKSFQFWLRVASHLPDYTASELEDVALASQPFQLGPN